MQVTCKNCAHFRQSEEDKDNGHCRERLFSVVTGTSYFPPVKATWECGQFKPKPKKTQGR